MPKHIYTLSNGFQHNKKQESTGCKECPTSCQSACKTSCTVGNQACINQQK